MAVRQVELGDVAGPADGDPLAADPVQAGVDDDPVQPGRDRGLAAVGVGAAEGRDEGLLDGVGRELAVRRRAQGHGVHPVAVAAEELAEGRATVAGDVPGHEVAVAEREEVVGHRGAGVSR